nr:hypothetical protein CFP56_07714 [Quercus suber]
MPAQICKPRLWHLGILAGPTLQPAREMHEDAAVRGVKSWPPGSGTAVQLARIPGTCVMSCERMSSTLMPRVGQRRFVHGRDITRWNLTSRQGTHRWT